MGTLNEVYQLKPIALSASAILKIKKSFEDSFLESFNLKNADIKERGIFSDTFLYISDDGKVERLAIYSTDRIIDLGNLEYIFLFNLMPNGGSMIHSLKVLKALYLLLKTHSFS